MRRHELRFLTCLCMTALGLALPLAASERVGDITIYSADETAGFAYREGDRYLLDFPGVAGYELLDEAAEWHPMAIEEVVAAVEQISYPVRDLKIEIVILHVPRVEVVESSTEGSVVFLTPGRVSYPVEHIHYVVAHEIGHAVHRALMPDARRDLWLEYADLRGIALNGGGPDVPHARRPREIFAEDFRALFGGGMAALGGRVENHDLPPPSEVAGLREFFLALAGPDNRIDGVAVLPNPSTGDMFLRAPSGGGTDCLNAIRVYDFRGRLVRDLGSTSEGEILWDGRDGSGYAVAPGVYMIAGRLGDSHFTCKAIRMLR